MTDFDALAHWCNRATTAEREVDRLRAIILALAERVAAQSELLSKRAEA